jgi:hypothetical protein
MRRVAKHTISPTYVECFALSEPTSLTPCFANDFTHDPSTQPQHNLKMLHVGSAGLVHARFGERTDTTTATYVIATFPTYTIYPNTWNAQRHPPPTTWLMGNAAGKAIPWPE